MGPASSKLYDKFSLILWIETTVNDLKFFKHYREVERRNGNKGTKRASLQKPIYSRPLANRSAGFSCKVVASKPLLVASPYPIRRR
jgi:hypothetical protein